MRKGKKIAAIVAGAIAAVIVVVAVVLFFAADMLINSDWVKNRVTAGISRAVEGSTSYEKVDVAFFPRLFITVHRLTVSRPEESGTVKTIFIYPEFISFLRGDLRIKEIRAEEPSFNIVLPKRREPFSLTALEKKITPVFESIVEHAPALNLHIARGTLTIAESGGEPIVFRNIELQASLADGLNLTAGSDSSAWGRVELRGRILHDPGAITVDGISGVFGKSKISGLSGRLDWSGAAYLNAQASSAFIVLEELHTWGAAWMKNVFRQLKSIRGTVTLTSIRFEGPLEKPDKWLCSFSGALENVAVDASPAPAPVRISGAKFAVARDMFSFQNAHTAFLDTSLVLSGSVQMKGMETSGPADVTFSGAIGNDTVRWASGLFTVPAIFRIPPSLCVTRARVMWNAWNRFLLEGDFILPEGPRIVLDLSRTPSEAVIRRMHIKDKKSDAIISLVLARGSVGFSFSGNLQKETVDALLYNDQPRDAWVAGNLTGSVIIDNPVLSTARGAVRAGNVSIPIRNELPLIVHSLALRADADKYIVDSSGLSWMDQTFSAKGSIRKIDGDFVLDMDISADRIGLDRIIARYKPAGAEGQEGGKEGTGPERKGWIWDLPVRGAVRIAANRLSYSRYNAEPFTAEIVLKPEQITVIVDKALVCGLPVPGVMNVTPGELTMDFRSVSVNKELPPVLSCLFGGAESITGRFDFRARMKANGNVLDSLKADGELSIRDGRIYKLELLSKILEFINITQVLTGRLPGIGKEGMPFDRVKLIGQMQDRKLELNRILMDGPTLGIVGEGTIDFAKNEMNLTLLVSPLRTVDTLLRKIPVLRKLRKVATIPVGVYGRPDDPLIVPLSPAAVGSQILEIMKSILKAPLDIFTPILPDRKKKK
ncbi:MAG: AsmA-like C-terminal domain-containing protein [Syntrophales bacterium]